jgi:uncharacterized protein (TIGR02466 family)
MAGTCRPCCAELTTLLLRGCEPVHNVSGRAREVGTRSLISARLTSHRTTWKGAGRGCVNNSRALVPPITSDLLFATPVFRQEWPDDSELNHYLRKLILSWERADAGSMGEYSNVGGWHSPIDLHECWDSEIRLVLERCRELASEATTRLLGPAGQSRRCTYALSAWANVSRQGDYNVPHVHLSTWSAVYYVSVPPGCESEQRAGGLELLDPRPATAMVDMPGAFFATRHLIKPHAGLLVLFPASVMHFVHPFRGEGERISLACDLTLEPG